MASALKNLSEYSSKNLVKPEGKQIALLVAEWNEEITGKLLEGAYSTFIKEGFQEDQLIIRTVPGSFELSLGAQWMAQDPKIDAVVCLGCIIQGETRHFDFIAHAVAQGITDVSLKYNKPVIFGVLTPDTMEQALDRAGGKHGNKGDEAAATALKMLGF